MTHHPEYPGQPGHRGVDTSVAAAASIAHGLGYLQAKVFRAIAEAGSRGLTTNELAQRLRIDRGSVQPRTSELKAQKKIRDSGQRRFNANGKKAIVWVAMGEGR
ncbi:MAG TPA: helix-turn-helix domain-containing protein [Sphingobium sp.]|nr:helix-turn-helix domain-containing protein [Sphingobium sp.]